MSSGGLGVGGKTVSFTITKADGSPAVDVFGNTLTTTVTDENGNYLFEFLPPGDYKVTYQRRGWRPMEKLVKVEKGKVAKVSSDLRGYTLTFSSRPPSTSKL